MNASVDFAAIDQRVRDSIEDHWLRFEVVAFLKGHAVLYVRKPQLGGWCVEREIVPAPAAARLMTVGRA